eukprot:Pgem_evm1s7046
MNQVVLDVLEDAGNRNKDEYTEEIIVSVNFAKLKMDPESNPETGWSTLNIAEQRLSLFNNFLSQCEKQQISFLEVFDSNTITPEIFRREYEGRKPVVLSGLLHEWCATTKWQ